jgi:hypothetical protein
MRRPAIENHLIRRKESLIREWLSHRCVALAVYGEFGPAASPCAVFPRARSLRCPAMARSLRGPVMIWLQVQDVRAEHRGWPWLSAIL